MGNAQKEAEREFRIINAANALADNSAQNVACTRTGRMIISTLGNVNFYDGNSFTHIETRPEYMYQLPMYRGKDRMFFDRYHHLWLKNMEFVTCVDLMQEQFVKDVNRVVREEFKCDAVVEDLFVDSIGDVWFLTTDGLYGANQHQTYPVLKDLNLQDIDVVDGKTLIAFYESGEEVGIDLEKHNVVHRTKAYDADMAEKYTQWSQIMRYRDGFLQLRNGADEGILLYFDLKKLEWTTLLTTDYHLNDMALRDSLLYMASGEGYWVFNLNTRQADHYGTLSLKGTNHKMNIPTSAIVFDRQGGLWVGTEDRGLLYAHPRNIPFKVYATDSPEAKPYVELLRDIEGYQGEFQGLPTHCQLKDSREWTWFGTTRGLYMYRTPQSEPVIFTKRRGLLNNVIHSVVEDLDHNIWVGTSCGISVITFESKDPKIPYFVNSYNAIDNIPNESFLDGKALCLDDGRIVMQSIDHIVVFEPAKFTTTHRKFERMYPKLISMIVNGNFVQPGEEIDGNVIIDRAITRIREVNLNADQNTVSFTFSGLNYFRPVQTYYRVRVPGLFDEWRNYSYYDGTGLVDSKGMLHLPLVGLKPGDYEIYVQASMYPDMWPSDDDRFWWTVHVNQPWWQSVGVYVILGLLVLMMLALNFYVYTKNMRMRAQVNGEEGEIIRKIRSFVDRCETFMTTSFAPSIDDSFERASINALSPEFISIMTKVMPFVLQHKTSDFTMRQLSQVSGVEVSKLYDVLTAHLYKSPHSLARHLLLERGAKLLRETDMTIEQIAQDCTFYTPNYFIGNFFHQFKMTPGEYRREMKG